MILEPEALLKAGADGLRGSPDDFLVTADRHIERGPIDTGLSAGDDLAGARNRKQLVHLQHLAD